MDICPAGKTFVNFLGRKVAPRFPVNSYSSTIPCCIKVSLYLAFIDSSPLKLSISSRYRFCLFGASKILVFFSLLTDKKSYCSTNPYNRTVLSGSATIFCNDFKFSSMESGTSSVLNYCVSPMSSAFFISSCMSGSRSLATRLSSTASFRYCFSSPTCLHGGRLNIFIISLPSMTGCNRRL